jgi:hypothetical protein
MPKSGCYLSGKVCKSLLAAYQGAEDSGDRIDSLIYAILKPKLGNSNIPVICNLIEILTQLEVFNINIPTPIEPMGWMKRKPRQRACDLRQTPDGKISLTAAHDNEGGEDDFQP